MHYWINCERCQIDGILDQLIYNKSFHGDELNGGDLDPISCEQLHSIG